MARLLDLLRGNEAELEEQEFAAKRSAGMILWIIAGFLGVFLIWAWLTELDRSVNAVGRVVPSSKMQVVSNLEGGVIEAILVKAGQVVKKGDILVRLSPTLSAAEAGSNAASVDALRAKVAQRRSPGCDAQLRRGAGERGGDRAGAARRAGSRTVWPDRSRQCPRGPGRAFGRRGPVDPCRAALEP
jgi:multidrug efflux pump subunit AcrA (membrane-fusion protein)